MKDLTEEEEALTRELRTVVSKNQGVRDRCAAATNKLQKSKARLDNGNYVLEHITTAYMVHEYNNEKIIQLTEQNEKQEEKTMVSHEANVVNPTDGLSVSTCGGQNISFEDFTLDVPTVNAMVNSHMDYIMSLPMPERRAPLEAFKNFGKDINNQFKEIIKTNANESEIIMFNMEASKYHAQQAEERHNSQQQSQEVVLCSRQIQGTRQDFLAAAQPVLGTVFATWPSGHQLHNEYLGRQTR